MSHPRTDADKERFAALLVSGATLTDAAAHLGIARATASRWRLDPVVLDAFMAHRCEVRSSISYRLGTLTTAALDRAEQLLANTETPPSVIVRLLALLLAESRLYIETTELSERLDRMEHRLAHKEELPDEI
jgi:acyl carrier protein phosphodiesterase